MLTSPTTTGLQVSNGPSRNYAGEDWWECDKTEVSISPINLAEAEQRIQADGMGKHTQGWASTPAQYNSVKLIFIGIKNIGIHRKPMKQLNGRETKTVVVKSSSSALKSL